MSAMHFASLIDLSLVFLRSPLKDLKGIYTFMVSQICKKYPSKNDEKDLIERLCDRKLNEGILFPSGAAVPHLHIESFNDTVISLLIPEKPLETEYGTVKIFFMVFTCKSDNSLYLHILQSIIRLSKDELLFSNSLAARTPNEFITVLKKSDLSVKRTMTVSDIMTTKVFTVAPENTLKELAQLFYEHSFEYFLVVNDRGKLVGEVTILDYLMVGLPEYTSFLNNLYFLKTFEPFENLLKDEHKITVSSIMKPVEISLPPDASIFKTVFLMNKYKKKDIAVIDKGKLVGIISYNDIFRKIVKG